MMSVCSLHTALLYLSVLQVVPGDLDQPTSLLPHLARVSGVYCHALSGDAASADPAELARGKALAKLLSSSDVRQQLQLVVYNSSAGRGSNAGISQVSREQSNSSSCIAGPQGSLAHGAANHAQSGAAIIRHSGRC